MLIAFTINGQNPFKQGSTDIRPEKAQSSKLISQILRLYVTISTRAGRSLKLLTSNPILIQRIRLRFGSCLQTNFRIQTSSKPSKSFAYFA